MFLFAGAGFASVNPANTPEQSDYPNAAAIILNSKMTADYTVKPYTLKVERTIKIFNQRGIERFGETKIRFDKETEEIDILKAETIKNNGEVVKVKEKAINEITPPELSEANIYSHIREKVLNMPALKPGVIINYSYQKKIKEPVMDGEFWTEKYLQSTEPIKKSSLIVKVPKNKKLNYKVKSEDLEPQINNKDNYKEYMWQVKEVKGIEKENSMPPLADIANRVSVSTLASWNQVSEWYNGLLGDQFKPNRELKNKVADLCKGKKTRGEKIKSIYNYVAGNIRYVGLEFGIGGYKPHDAVEVFTNKYGDCKDQDTLLITMLKQIHIEAEPVLINSVSNPKLEVITPTQFNHMIVYLPEDDLYLDPTSNLTLYGDLPPGDQGKKVLLPTMNKIKDTPVMSPAKNQEIINTDVKITNDGSSELEMKWQDHGYYDSVYKQLFRRFNQSRRGMVIRQIVKNSLPDAQIKNYKISGVEGLEDNFKIDISLTSSGYLSKMGNNYTIKPLLFPMNLYQLVSEETRDYPLNLGVTLNFKRDIEIEIPEGYQVNYLPENNEIDNEVGHLILTYNNKGQKIQVSLNLRIKNKVISVENYDLAKDLFNQVKNALQQQILIKKI